MPHKTLHRKLQIEQQEHHWKQGINTVQFFLKFFFESQSVYFEIVVRFAAITACILFIIVFCIALIRTAFLTSTISSKLFILY